MQLDNDNDNQRSSDEDEDDGAHTVCKVMTSRTDSNAGRREFADNDIEYIRRVRDVSKECPKIVSLINKFNA